MRAGIKKSELRSRLFAHASDKLWRDLTGFLRSEHIIEETGEYVKLRSHQPQVPAQLKPLVERMVATLRKEGLTVSDWGELAKKTGLKQQDANELKAYCIEQEGFVAMGVDFIVDSEVYRKTVESLQGQLPKGEPFSTPQVKEILGVSRKYLIPFLESLDENGWTKRLENERIWLKPPS